LCALRAFCGNNCFSQIILARIWKKSVTFYYKFIAKRAKKKNLKLFV
jgi:hypothetical protein